MSETATEPTHPSQPAAPAAQSAQSAQPAQSPQSGWHQVPLVNLLPPEIVEGRRFARTRKALVGVLVTTLLIGALATVSAQRSVNSARTELDQATSEVSSLQQQQQKYKAVPALAAQIQAATDARTAAMSQDVLWYRMLTDMDGARPGAVTTGSITVTMSGPQATPAQPDPLTKAGIGTVTFAGSAGAYEGVSAFIEALDAVSGLGSTALSDASKDQDGKVSYTVSSVVTDGALSHRYTTKGH